MNTEVTKAKLNPKWYDYAANKSHELDELVDEANTYKKLISYMRFSCLGLIALVFVVSALPTSARQIFLSVDEYGAYIPQSAARTQKLTPEERAEHAKYLVMVLNSLGHEDKDALLSANEHYFDPQVFKQYIIKQHEIGYFDHMTKYNITYIPEVRPAVEVNGERHAILYSNNNCYDPDVMGDGRKIGIDCRFNQVDTRQYETYLFDVNRFIYFNGEKLDQ